MVYKENTIHPLLMALLNYLAILIFKRKCMIPVIIVSFGYLSALNIHRMVTNYGGWSISVSGTLMCLTIKSTALAWNYIDGGKPDEKLSEDQLARKVVKIPNVLEYFSYMNFYGGALVGPTFDFAEYQEFIERRDGYKSVPSTILASLKTLLFAGFFMFSTAVIMPKAPMDWVSSDEFAEQSILYKFVYYNVSVTLHRFKYYAGWILGQAAITAAGLSYNGYDDDKGVNKWNRIVAAEPKLELIGDPRTKLELWNTYSQVWLRRYIYLRIVPEKSNNSPARVTLGAYATMIVSAFWHGFYPMYYFAFIQLAFVVNISKFIFKAGDKFRFLPKIVVVILKQLITNVVFNYLGTGFLMLSIEKGLKFYAAIYYIPTIMIFSTFAFFTITQWGQRKSSKRGNEIKEKAKAN
jgi:lysophospholipid acyltransferase